MTAAHGAAFSGRKDLLKILIAAGADIHAEDARGNTPLEVRRLWLWTLVSLHCLTLGVPRRCAKMTTSVCGWRRAWHGK